MDLPENLVIAASALPPEKRWKEGYGVIKHSPQTQARVRDMVAYLNDKKMLAPGVSPYELLAAGDVIASAGMWLVVHSSYAQNVYTDGRTLQKDDFKVEPEGHTGGSLNMVPGYVGYLMLNALMGKTRAWTMEQGHAVCAIDSVNLLTGNMKPAHAERYSVTDEGLSRFSQDFYSFKLGRDGKQDSPRGSHVNHNTAGGFIEGGYLGFVSDQYVHIPLPHERLVVFLSDGAFEEQRGGDWAAHFWRAEDSGLVSPIMILNGRRIDQRSTMSQSGGADWLAKYLKLHHFDPIIFDGRDP
jgi:phosphoketolase